MLADNKQAYLEAGWNVKQEQYSPIFRRINSDWSVIIPNIASIWLKSNLQHPASRTQDFL